MHCEGFKESHPELGKAGTHEGIRWICLQVGLTSALAARSSCLDMQMLLALEDVQQPSVAIQNQLHEDVH